MPLRNRRTVDVRAAGPQRSSATSMPIAAIVYPAVQLEVLNTTLWPDFPYRQARPVHRRVDADGVLHVPLDRVGAAQRVPLHRRQRRSAAQPSRRRRRARAHHRWPRRESTPDDYLDLDRAARTTKAVGWSVYDYATTGSWAWPYLRGEVPVPTTVVPPTTVAPTTVAPTRRRPRRHRPDHDHDRPDRPRPSRPTPDATVGLGASDEPRLGRSERRRATGACQSNLSAEYFISFCHLWVASMVRMVPDFERITSDCVLAPLPQ